MVVYIGKRQEQPRLVHIVGSEEHLDHVAVRELVIAHGNVRELPVDAEEPAGILSLAELGHARAVGVGDRLHIASLRLIGVAVGREHLPEHIHRRRALGLVVDDGRLDPHVGVCVQLEGDGAGRDLRLVARGGRAADDQARGNSLMAQRLEIGVVRVTRGVLAERLARELADDRDGLVLRRARYEQVFMADDGRIRRAEQAPPLAGLPARQLRGDDAVVGLIVNVVHPDELAVGVQIRLAEGVQVAGDVVGIGVAVADAVKVMRLDCRISFRNSTQSFADRSYW